MGVQDHDWYSEALRQRERSTHGPSASLPRPGTVGGSRASVCFERGYARGTL